MIIDVTDSVLIDRLCEAWWTENQRIVFPNHPAARSSWADNPPDVRDVMRQGMIALLPKLAEIAHDEEPPGATPTGLILRSRRAVLRSSRGGRDFPWPFPGGLRCPERESFDHVRSTTPCERTTTSAPFVSSLSSR